jgi:PEP-CTERM motif-containing protein
MRALFRHATLLAVVFAASATPARTEPITVGEFRWDVCKGFDPGCGLSNFVLTNLWDDPSPAPALTSGQLTLSDGTITDWLGLDDQLLLAGVPAFARTTIAFDFNGIGRTITETLTGADLVEFTGDPTTGFGPYSSAFVLLKFDPDTALAPVPEPGTLALLASGIAMLGARISRNRKR